MAFPGGPASGPAPRYLRQPRWFSEWQPRAKDRPRGPRNTWATPTYIKPRNNINTFQLGEVINRPYHVPNRNATLQPGDRQLRETWLWNFNRLCGRNLQTWVFTKPRMFVVLFKHEFSMFCLPIGSQDDEGLTNVPDWRQHEMVQVRDRMLRDNFVTIGQNEVIDFVHRSQDINDALSPNSMINLANGTTMSWEEEALWSVGRITERGYERLLAHYNNMVNQAQAQGAIWPADDGWRTPPLFQRDDFPPL